MRRLKDIYPDYADKVAFYAVGTDPTESLKLLEDYRKRQGYPWPVAEPSRDMLAALGILRQSTKVAFDGHGIITYREGYGRGNADTWRKVFENLTSQR